MMSSFDKVYKSNNNIRGTNYHKILEYFALNKNFKNVLDIGAGDGRNSIYLAQLGYQVTALDSSQEGLNKLKQKSTKLGLNIETKCIDIEKYEFKDSFDIIICINVLHFLQNEKSFDIIENIKKITNKGGVNLITVFNIQNPQKYIGLFPLFKLKNLYLGWKILDFSEKFGNREKHGLRGEMHRHNISTVLSKNI